MDQLASFEIHNLGLMRRHSVSSLKTNSTYLTFASGTELSTSTAQTTSTTSSLIPLNGPVGSSPYPKLRLNDKSAEDRSWPAITKSKKKFGFFKDGKDTSTVAGAFAVTPEEYGIAPSRQDPKFIVKYTYNADDEDSTWYVSRGVPSGLAARARDRVKAEEQVGATVYAVSDEQRAEMERALGSLDDTPDPIEMALKELKRAKMTKESEGSQSQAKDGDNSPGRSGRGSDGGKKSAEEDARSAGAAVAQENVEDMERVFNRRPEARPRTPSPLARAMDDVMSYLDSVELDWKRSRKPWHALPRQPITMSETDYSAIKSYSPPKGRKVLSFARPLYSYIAAIPEELGFGKKDLLAILYKQDDGWWEAEVVRDEERFRGLAPSNYLEEIFVVSKSDDGGLPSKLESAMIEERAKSKRKSVTFADRSDDSAGSWTSNSYK